MKNLFSAVCRFLRPEILLLILLLWSLCPAPALEAAPVVPDRDKPAAASRIVVDQIGNEVELPAEVNRVVIASAWPLASVFCLFEGNVEKLVGLDPAIISAAENSLLIKVAPEIVHVPSGFSKNGILNVEELLKLKPDVVLYASAVPGDYEACKQAGIPAVGFRLDVKDFNAVETINSWMELLGRVMNTNIEANDFVAYGREMQAKVEERLKGVPRDKKPRCMFIHGYEALAIRVPGASSWADYWINASGGVNVAAEAGKGTLGVNMEQIYAWNPEKIFITNFLPLLPDDLYGNRVTGHDWAPVEAVKQKAVRKLPLGMYRWYVTCSDSALMLLWMAKENQPELFEDIDMNRTVKDFYKRFYGLSLSDEEVASVFRPKREAAAGI